MGKMTVTLNSVDNAKTEFTVQTLNTGQTQQTNISEMKLVQTNFLNAISNILQGKDNPTDIVVAKGTGCLGSLIFIVSTIGALVALLMVSVINL